MTDGAPRDPAGAPEPSTEELSAEELAVWRGFLRWSERVTGRVGADIAAGVGLSRPEYEVLRRLVDHGGALPQHELQNGLQWSASRASHQLRRMSARGLLRREETGPGRPVLVALLPPGRDRMAEADRVHARAVRTHFLAGLPGDASSLRASLRAIGSERSDQAEHLDQR